MDTTNIREHRGCYVCEDCSPVLSMEQSTEESKVMDSVEVSMGMSPSCQIQETKLPSEYWEVVDLTTPPSSQEPYINRVPQSSLASSSSASADSIICTKSDSTQLSLAPPTFQLPRCRSESYTITLCTCDECISGAPSPTTSFSLSTGNDNCGDKDAAMVQQLLVSISTSKLVSIPKTGQEVEPYSRKRLRSCLT